MKQVNWLMALGVGGVVVATLFTFWSMWNTDGQALDPANPMDIPTGLPSVESESGLAAQAVAEAGATYYVSIRGNNLDGSSWESAWRDFDQVDWAEIEPGALILVDGGEVSMRYQTPLLIGASGTQETPIRLQLADESGRNGQAILDGGGGFLPECRNEKPGFAESAHPFGIDTQNHSWIVIDGTKWQGIVVRNFQNGVLVDRGSTDVVLRNMELVNNGFMREYVDNSYPLWVGGWGPDGFGVKLGGMNHRFSRMIIHDNGGDQIQSLWEYNRNGSEENNLGSFELTLSWLYNERRHSVETIPTEQIDHERLQNLSFNFCAHADGVQIHDGGLVQGITITESVIGPGQTNNLILGTRDRGKAAVDVHDLLLQDVLLLKGADSSLLAPSGTDPQNWTLDRVTVHCMDAYENRLCVKVTGGKGHVLSNSVLFSAPDEVPIRVEFASEAGALPKNVCVSQTESPVLAQATVVELPFAKDPTAEDGYGYFSLEDYRMAADSPCAGIGSMITSVEMLLQK